MRGRDEEATNQEATVRNNECIIMIDDGLEIRDAYEFGRLRHRTLILCEG
jgi:hypothetical protein